MTVLTVRQIRERIRNLDDDVEIDFGATREGKRLLFYRFKERGPKLLQIELNGQDP
jgi:hypothetical protein